MAFDPARFDSAWARYTQKLAAQHPPFMSYFAAGASDSELRALVQALGLGMPDDLVHLLRRHNGSSEVQVLPGWELFSTVRISDEWHCWEDLRRDQFMPDGLTCQPEGPVKSDEWWWLGWIPFCGDGGGNHLCVDMDPARGGADGQVINMWHDDPTRAVVAESLTAYVELIADKVEAGELHWDDDWGGVYEPVEC